MSGTNIFRPGSEWPSNLRDEKRATGPVVTFQREPYGRLS
ncbi:MAG: hypothetical protein QOF46_972, partial [Paraburkholderia sp.]|nr:hypothetical protein [Paraburkholderia sp.]